MRRAILYALVVVFAAWGQEVEKVLAVPFASTPQDLNEVATILRSTIEVPELRGDAVQRTIWVRGPGDRVAAAEWLIGRLARLPARPGAPDELRMPNAVVRVFHTPFAETPQQRQELVTLIRAVADLSRIYIYNSQKDVVAQGTREQIDLAEWLIRTIGQPEGFSRAVWQYGSEKVYAVSLPRLRSAEELKQVAVRLRREAALTRLFVYNDHKAVAFRATPDQIVTAERILAQVQ